MKALTSVFLILAIVGLFLSACVSDDSDWTAYYDKIRPAVINDMRQKGYEKTIIDSFTNSGHNCHIYNCAFGISAAHWGEIEITGTEIASQIDALINGGRAYPRHPLGGRSSETHAITFVNTFNEHPRYGSPDYDRYDFSYRYYQDAISRLRFQEDHIELLGLYAGASLKADCIHNSYDDLKRSLTYLLWFYSDLVQLYETMDNNDSLQKYRLLLEGSTADTLKCTQLSAKYKSESENYDAIYEELEAQKTELEGKEKEKTLKKVLDDP